MGAPGMTDRPNFPAINTAIAEALGIPLDATAATIRLRPGQSPQVVIKRVIMDVPPRIAVQRFRIVAEGGKGGGDEHY